MDPMRRAVTELGAILTCWAPAFALTPELDVSQYARSRGRIATVSQGYVIPRPS